MEIFKEITFEAAHRLPNLPEEHKCRRLHGHTYYVVIHVNGPIDEKTGWVMDFAAIKKAFTPLRAQLDHHYLNDIPGLENPTAEILSMWIWDRLKPSLPHLSKIVIKETCTSGIVYYGENSNELSK
jgi:6-pyruvoyltetrahydropterin/6-carboxytetrahydropterin synthase